MLAFIIPSVERVGDFQDILHLQLKIYFIGNRRYTSSAIEDILVGQSKYIFSENGMVSSNCQKPGL